MQIRFDDGRVVSLPERREPQPGVFVWHTTGYPDHLPAVQVVVYDVPPSRREAHPDEPYLDA